jgi:malate dehydrogenase (oxaloacetate-decarboxylating)(NADP+)
MFNSRMMRNKMKDLLINKTKNFRSPSLIQPLSHSAHSMNVFDPNPESQGARIGEVVLTSKHGVEVLLDPQLNKGTGFTSEERERLAIRGLVPPMKLTKNVLEWQANKIMHRFSELQTPISKYTYMTALQDRNEVLFYKCLVDNLETLAPIVYTPTVGEACINFNTLFRRPRGMYFSSEDKGMMHAMTYNWHTDDVELIVVTDGSRILGLGDLGTNGMGIPIGKLSLYTAGAGIHPSKCLPCIIDVGTNNQSLLEDSFYLGLQQKRLKGAEYDEIVDEFMRAVKERFPNALVQFEDFSTENASRILERYKDNTLCFNDDMQGTSTVALAGVMSALRFLGNKNPTEALKDQRIVVVGAGTAGLGVAKGMLFSMMQSGLKEFEARKRFWIIDEQGALGALRKVSFENQEPWVRHDVQDKIQLEEVIRTFKPTVLLGLTGVGGLFNEKVIREMGKNCERPIIFPLSNPTHKAECTAKDAYEWTEGRCIYASGSPFAPVDYNGTTLIPAQANNMYTYPGLGLGALVCKARKITDTMLNTAARALCDAISEQDLAMGRIFPRVAEIPRISKEIAVAVAKQAQNEDLAKHKFENENELRRAINDRFWVPRYGSMVRVEHFQIS